VSFGFLALQSGFVVKFTAKAGDLAGALGLAASAMRANKQTSEPVRFAAANDVLSITGADPHTALVTLVQASVVEAGECALSADRLAALVAGFAVGVQLMIGASDSGATVAYGNGKYRLPVVPGTDLPAPLALNVATAGIEIGGDDVLFLLEPLFIAVDEETRFRMGGLFLHSVDGRLVGVATNGVGLVRVSIPAAEFSLGRDLILPSKPAAALRRIIMQMKPKKHVTLRRSRSLIEVSGSGFSFTSRLIDSVFPPYEAIVPAPSPNVITCARAELLAALARLAAVANVDHPPLLSVSWTDAGQLCLTLARQPRDAADIVAAETRGIAKFAVPLWQLVEMLNDFKAERIRFETRASGPLVIQGDGGAMNAKNTKLALLMPAAWNFGGEEAHPWPASHD
jgi:DNA polymerase-3 subunit beta